MLVRNRISQPRLPAAAIDGLTLKILGWVFTLAGMIAAVFYNSQDSSTPRMLMLLISYLALPIFAFLVVEGVRHTGNFWRYVGTTLAAAIVSEPFYDFARTGSWWNMAGDSGQNVLFTLVLCQIVVYFLKFLGQNKVLKVLISVVVIIAGALWTILLNTQYGLFLILASSLFYLFREHAVMRNISVCVISIPWYFTPEFSLILIHKYNGVRGDYSKYIFYALYPAMWLILAIVRLVMR